MADEKYVYQEYPRWLYHAKKEPVLVKDAAEEKKMVAKGYGKNVRPADAEPAVVAVSAEPELPTPNEPKSAEAPVEGGKWPAKK